MRKLLEAMYLVCKFDKVDFRELVHEGEPTHSKSLLDSVDVLFSD